MKKSTKIIIALALLALVIGGLWFYWEQELVLGDIIPAGDMRVQFYIVTPGVGATDIQLDEQIEDLMLDTVRSAAVTRGPEFYALPEYCYELRLTGDSYPTLVYVGKDGRISVAVELDLDHYQYFEDHGELYAALDEILALDAVSAE